VSTFDFCFCVQWFWNQDLFYPGVQSKVWLRVLLCVSAHLLPVCLRLMSTWRCNPGDEDKELVWNATPLSRSSHPERESCLFESCLSAVYFVTRSLHACAPDAKRARERCKWERCLAELTIWRFGSRRKKLTPKPGSHTQSSDNFFKMDLTPVMSCSIPHCMR
jgi:hypothetical protein